MERVFPLLEVILNFEEKGLSIVGWAVLRFLSLLNVERKQALDRQKKREAEEPGGSPKTKHDVKIFQVVASGKLT